MTSLPGRTAARSKESRPEPSATLSSGQGPWAGRAVMQGLGREMGPKTEVARLGAGASAGAESKE